MNYTKNVVLIFEIKGSSTLPDESDEVDTIVLGAVELGPEEDLIELKTNQQTLNFFKALSNENI